MHEEGSYLAKVVINKLTGIKSNLIIDKVFPEYNKLLKQIDALKNSGYKVRVVYVSIDDYKEQIAYLKDVKTEGWENEVECINVCSQEERELIALFVRIISAGLIKMFQKHFVSWWKIFQKE